MTARNSAHTHGSTSRSAKFSLLLSDARAQAAVTMASIGGASDSYRVSDDEDPRTACAAASRAIGTRNGEQET